MTEQEQKPTRPYVLMAAAFVGGMAGGIAIGIAAENMTLGIALGVALGAAGNGAQVAWTASRARSRP